MQIDLINGTFRYNEPGIFGIKRYIWEIHRRLPHIDLNIVEFANRKFGLGAHLDRLINDYIYHPLRVRQQLIPGNIQLMVAQSFLYLFNTIRLSSCAVICHDLIRLTRPQDYPSRMNDILIRQSYRNFNRADRIVTVSKHTENVLLKHYDLPKNRVRVISNGVELQQFAPNPEQGRAFRTRFGLEDRRIVLYVGSEEPRKNLPILIEAIAGLRRRVPKLHFVKVGRPQYPNGRKIFLRAIEDHGIGDITTILEDMSDESEGLPAAYNAADVFVFPSLDEGFGLPPLEAMASGTPVITSDAASLPEVVGNGGILISPDKAEAFVESAFHVLTDEALSESLTERGLSQARKFRWEDSAEKMQRLYTEMAALNEK